MAKVRDPKDPQQQTKGKVVDMGGATVEEGVKAAPVEETAKATQPVEDVQSKPEPVELSEEQKAAHMKQVISQRIGEFEARLAANQEVFKETGYHLHGYSPEAKVEIPGQLFADFVNFAAAIGEHFTREREMMQDMMSAGENLYLGAIQFQSMLGEMHVENCKAGITTTPEERDALLEKGATEAAEKEIKVVDKKKKKKKAKGSTSKKQ